MGTRFRYVADDAANLVISSMMPNCHVCKQMVEEVFGYFETVELSDGTVDSIRQVCEACLRAGPKVRENPWLLKAADKHFGVRAGKNSKKPPALIEALDRFARTPRPTMPQGTDWPLCCKDFCELYASGNEDDLSMQTSGARMWDWGPANVAKATKILRGQPEFGEDLMFFRCPTCASRYFTFQPT